MWKPLAFVIVAAFMAGCQSSSDSSSNSGITQPTVNPTVENFTGTVDVGGTDSHPFTVALSGGQLAVTLTAAGPPATIFMGLGVGSWTASTSTCTPISGASTIVQAGTTPQLNGTANGGAFCVMVYDVGNQASQVTYAVTVSHY